MKLLCCIALAGMTTLLGCEEKTKETIIQKRKGEIVC